MKYIFFYLFIFFQNIANCQTLAYLDQTNGFKIFKFGMSPSQFQDKIKEKAIRTTLKKVKKYYYTGNEIKFLHGVEIESIELAFFDDKLYMIGVNFGSLSKEYSISEQKSLIYGLKSNFGIITHDCRSPNDDNSKVLNCTIWDGQAVRLEHIRVDFSNHSDKEDSKFNSITGYLLFTNKKMHEAQQNSELEN